MRDGEDFIIPFVDAPSGALVEGHIVINGELMPHDWDTCYCIDCPWCNALKGTT